MHVSPHSLSILSYFEQFLKIFVIFRKLKRKQLKDTEAKTIVQRAVGQTDFKGFQGVDVVIEAIVENLEIKQKVIKELETVCHEDFIFASNTSSLPLTEMSKAAKKSLGTL